MKLHIVLPILLLPLTHSNLLTNNLTEIISLSFPYHNCLYLFGAGKTWIFEALGEIPIDIVVITNLEYDQKMYRCRSRGYIVEYEEEMMVEALFRHMPIFHPHNRILIIAPMGHDLKRVVTKARYYGLDVMCVELIATKTSEMLPEELTDFRVINLLTDEVVLNRSQYVLKKWRPRFGRTSVKVLTLPYPPFTYKIGKRLRGFEQTLVRHLTLGWPIQYVEYPSYSWVELLKDLEEFKGNISIASHWRSRIVKHDLDLTHPYTNVESTFAVPKPKTKSFADLILRPFGSITWCILLLSIVVTSKVMHHFDDGARYSTLDCIFISINCLALNSLRRILKNRLRFVLFMWSMMSLLLSTAYSAGFSSVVSVPAHTKAISTFEDLDRAKIQCTVSSKYIQEVGVLSDNPYLTRISDNVVFNVSDETTRCILGDIVYQRYMIMPFSVNKEKDWKLLRENFEATSLVIALNKNSPYTKILDRRIKRLLEYGFIEHWFKQSKTDFDNVFPKSQFRAKREANQPFTFSKVRSVFYFWMCGITGAAVIFTCEKISRH